MISKPNPSAIVPLTKQLPELPQVQSSTGEETIRAIIFPIAKYKFSLPIAAVVQVTKSPPKLNNLFGGLGLVMYENRPLMLLNLHQKLAGTASERLTANGNSSPASEPFLILTQTNKGEFCGIPVTEIPNMVDLPRSCIQTLPDSYRHQTLFSLARFVAFWQASEQEEKQPVYLLDVNQALSFLLRDPVR